MDLAATFPQAFVPAGSLPPHPEAAAPPRAGAAAGVVAARAGAAGALPLSLSGLVAPAALVGLAALAARARGRRSKGRAARAPERLVRAATADEEGFSEEELKAAEAALEALEAGLEDLEDDFVGEAAARQAALDENVNAILRQAPPELKSSGVSVTAARKKLKVGAIAVCGMGEAGAFGPLVERIKVAAKAGGAAAPVCLDLKKAAGMPFEELDELMQGCEATIVCPDTADESPATLEAVKEGLKAILASAPQEMTKVVLLSHVGAQATKGGFNIDSFFGGPKGATWDSIEDELTSTARMRTSSRPLYYTIVRAGAPGGAGGAVRTAPAAELEEGNTSNATIAEALYQAFGQGTNSSFSVVGDAAAEADWDELLLPFCGPEVWRAEVNDAKRAAIFVQSWGQEFFGDGKGAKRLGVKTPVMLQNTERGIIFKFRPLGTEKEASFDDLNEGGVEFIAEVPPAGGARLRAVRCSYGWKVTVKENSETALLNKFAKDWAEVEKKP